MRLQIINNTRGLSLIFGIFSFFFFATSAVAQVYTTYTIAQGESGTHCINLDIFRNGAPDLYENTCALLEQDVTSYSVDLSTGCVLFNSTSTAGQDTICLRMCNTDLTECAAVNLIIDVYEAPVSFVDTIYRGQTEEVCKLSFPNLAGSIINMQNICAGAIPPFVNWEISSDFQCVTYTGMNLGDSRACIAAEDNLGMRDTIFLDVHVRNTETQYIETEIEEGENTVVCFDPLEISGRFSSVSDMCNEGDAALVAFDDVLNCLTVDALSVGSTFSCFVFCDDIGICDTVEIDVQVVPREPEGPSAIDDNFIAYVGQVNSYSVCSNDLNTEDLTSLRILPFAEGGIGPYAGSATVSLESCELHYEPLPNACELTDSLIYEVCVGDRCATAKVRLDVDCGETEEGLVVMNGFSPNGDGMNETLYIQGLEEYPQHTVTLYNRYGAEVYRTQNYQNDWRGTWDGVELPDGVYYYLIDTGQGEQSSGWVYVQR